MSAKTGELFDGYSFARLAVGIGLVLIGWKLMKTGWPKQALIGAHRESSAQFRADSAAICP